VILAYQTDVGPHRQQMTQNGAMITAMKTDTSVSPIDNVALNHPPTCVVNASGDTGLRPHLHSEALYKRLQELGVESHMCVAEGAPHGFGEFKISAPGTVFWETAILPAMEWAVERV
jgi:acetyl esterase/lipase